MTKQMSNSLEQTQKIAEKFIAKIKPKKDGATVVGLYGNLGAGKTTLIQYMAKSFGIDETVTSPTFVLEKIYRIVSSSKSSSKLQVASSKGIQETGFNKLIHIDVYRIEKSSELEVLAWKEIISDPNNIILIEWPERVADIMPEHIRINLSHISENSRGVEIL